MSGNDSGSNDPTLISDETIALGKTGDGHDRPPKLPDYRLLKLLGRGGMGEVWLAEQLEPVQRRVALKFVTTRKRQSLEAVMFEVERQLLARLHHPAIAQVFDAGNTEDGRPWFAMEWVRGQPVTDYCRDHRLDRAQILDLFIRICNGVEHAHRAGIIHRDLKPANVLVAEIDGTAMPKIIDFGVAASLLNGERAQAPASGSRAGTRAYMSPEQRSGNPASIDTRIDVYALGLLLYETLRGRRLSTENVPETLKGLRSALAAPNAVIKRSGDPSAASELPRELRCMLGRALAHNRDQRYGSVRELAEDIQRFLEHRAVNAVPASRAYLLRKFVRRNRTAVAAGVSIALALVLGLAASVWSLLEARQQLERAEQAQGFMNRMLASVNPQTAEGLDTTLLRRVLDDAATRAQEELGDFPAILSEIETTLGRAYTNISEFERGRAHLQNAIQRLEGSSADPRLAVGAQLALAYNFYLSGDGDQSLEITEALQPRIASLDRLDPLVLEFIGQHASALRWQGEAKRTLETVSAAISATAGRTEPRILEMRFELLRLAGQAHSDLGQLNRADQTFGLLDVELQEWDDPSASWHRFAMLNDHAVVLLRQRDYAGGERLLRESLALGEENFGPDDRRLIPTISNLASSIRQQDRLQESLPWFERGREVVRRSLGADHPYLVQFNYNEGNALRELGRIDEALTLQRRALDAAKQHWPASHPVFIEFSIGLGQTELAANHLDRAETLLRNGLERGAEHWGKSYHRVQTARDALIATLQQLKRPEAIAEIRQQFGNSNNLE